MNAKARNVVTISMVLMKMVIPTLILVTPLDHVVLLFTIIYTGFYLHFVQIIYEVVRNEDIKTRLHMIQALTKLIDI